MKPVAQYAITPAGAIPTPLSPAWPAKLAACETAEDLFALVQPGRFIDPDAFAEVAARGLVRRYVDWKRAQRLEIAEFGAAAGSLEAARR